MEPALKAVQNILPKLEARIIEFLLRVASDLSNASKACIGHQSTPPLFHVP